MTHRNPVRKEKVPSNHEDAAWTLLMVINTEFFVVIIYCSQHKFSVWCTFWYWF